MDRSRLVVLMVLLLLPPDALVAAAPRSGEVAGIPWSSGGNAYTATVTEETADGLAVRRVIFRRKGEPAPLPGVAYETLDDFVAAMPLLAPGPGHLLTLWRSGDSLRVVVFAPRVDGVAVVMDTLSSGLPELADLDGDGAPEILTTEGRRGNTPTAGDGEGDDAVMVGVHRWRGDRYRVERTVPWEKRLGGE